MSLFHSEWGPFALIVGGAQVPAVHDVLERCLPNAGTFIAAWDCPPGADLPDAADERLMAALIQPFAEQARVLQLPSLLPVALGVAADQMLTHITDGFEGDTAFVSLGGITSIYRRRHSPYMLQPAWAAEPMLEPLVSLASVSISRGAALAGQMSPVPWPGFADVIGCYARNAATAALAGFALAASCQPAEGTSKPAGAPMSAAIGTVADHLPHLEPEQTWEALASPARLAAQLRQQSVIHAAAISLRGRGRVIGNLDVDPLNRFRASVWR